jgi:hypothetical protein
MQGYNGGCCEWDGHDKRRNGEIVKVVGGHRCTGGGETTINKNITTLPMVVSSYDATIAANEPHQHA